jgi:hypothetical protein
LVICELCGTGNSELDTECRVCGQQLAVAVGAAQAQAEPAAVPPPASDIASVPAHLQMSTFAQDVSTGAPPMFGNSAIEEPVTPPPSPDAYVPAFLQVERRTQVPDAETTGLITANDLPDWIKQIAEQDAAKEAAQVEQAAAHADNFASIQRRQLPGETLGSGPQTNWLTKTAGAADSSEHWSSAEAASANWGVFEPPKQELGEAPVYEAAVPTTAFVPAVIEDARGKSGGRSGKTKKSAPKEAKVKQPKAEKQPKAPKAPKSVSTGGRRPFYRSTMVQLAFLLLLVVLLATMVLG